MSSRGETALLVCAALVLLCAAIVASAGVLEAVSQ